MKNAKIGRLLLLCGVVCVMAVTAWLVFHPSAEKKDTLIITMPETELVRNLDLNAYTLWLEDKANVNLEFNFIPETYEGDYIEQLFVTGNVKTDIVFSAEKEAAGFLTKQDAAQLGKMGYLLPLNDYITENTCMERIFSSFDDYDLRAYMTAEDGGIYYFPNLDATSKARMGQTLWLNRSWMQYLNITYPQTTDDLYDVLCAFADSDANQNGLRDEIPLAGSDAVGYLMNSFVYNDPSNMRLFVENGQVKFAPVTSRWRRGAAYVQTLYSEGLLLLTEPGMSERSFMELASSPGDYLGGFTAQSITDVLLSSCADRSIHFAAMSPVKRPDGIVYSVVKTPVPQIGAVISSQCQIPEKAFELLDLMLSEDAFLIAKYGEKDADWCMAAATDLDSYGQKAAIKILNSLEECPQNKNYSGMGPFFAYSKYADHVTWSGFDHEYLNARAYLTQLQYIPQELMGLPPTVNARWQRIQRYTDENLMAFITGEKDIQNDAQWQACLQGYEEWGLSELLEQMQNEYDRLQEGRR